MRWVALGLAATGAAFALAGLFGLGPAPHGQLVLGGVAVLTGAALAGMDRAFRAYVERLGVRGAQLSALRKALDAGTDRGLAAVERLRQAGLDGTAKILSVTDTGASFNQRPEVDLELEIEVQGRAPYRVRQRHLVPRDSAPRLRQGEILRVKIDPGVADRLLIDWQG